MLCKNIHNLRKWCDGWRWVSEKWFPYVIYKNIYTRWGMSWKVYHKNTSGNIDLGVVAFTTECDSFNILLLFHVLKSEKTQCATLEHSNIFELIWITMWFYERVRKKNRDHNYHGHYFNFGKPYNPFNLRPIS